MYTLWKMRARLKTDLHIRVMPRDVRNWRRAAKREGETLSEWIRAALNQRAGETVAVLLPAPEGS